jgi:AraC-like DNA-binding protein
MNGYSMVKQMPYPSTIHLRTRNRLPLKRSVYSVTILVDYAREQGIGADRILAGSGIRLQDLYDHEMFITPDQELQALRKVVELIPDPKLGLKVGKLYNISANGKVAIPAMFCNTFLDAIRMMYRYIELTLSFFQYELNVKGDVACMQMRELIDFGEIRRFVCEREIVSIFLMSGGILGVPLALREIRLAYPRPEYASYYQETFHCPVTFDAEEHQVLFERSYLFRPLPMANTLAKDAYEKECRRVYCRMNEQGTTLDRIRQELLYQEEEGFPSLEQLSRRLNVSPRTLRRHLTAEGTSYKNLIAEIRKKKAIDLLNTTNFPIEKIATELGYSDVPNFYHAFKSWTGKTPSSYRKNNL